MGVDPRSKRDRSGRASGRSLVVGSATCQLIGSFHFLPFFDFSFNQGPPWPLALDFIHEHLLSPCYGGNGWCSFPFLQALKWENNITLIMFILLLTSYIHTFVFPFKALYFESWYEIGILFLI